MKKTLIALGVGLLSGCAAFALDFPVDGDGKAIQQAIDRALGWNGIFFDYPARYLRPYDEGYQDISGILFDGYEGELTGSPIQIVAEPGVKIRGVRDITFRNFKVNGTRVRACQTDRVLR